MLERPPSLDGGKVLILGGPESFTACYIKRALECIGVPVTPLRRRPRRPLYG